jgi:hypothetical protein
VWPEVEIACVKPWPKTLCRAIRLIAVKRQGFADSLPIKVARFQYFTGSAKITALEAKCRSLPVVVPFCQDRIGPGALTQGTNGRLIRLADVHIMLHTL